MKFRASKQELSKHIQIAQRAVSSRTTMQILEGLLLIAKDNTLTVIGTDTDITIISTMACIVEEEGEVVVNSRLFGDIIRKLEDSFVDITLNDLNLNIVCKNSEFNINCQSAKEFPRNINFEDENSFTMKEEDLKEAIRKTTFAVSIEETRKIFTGVFMDCKEDISFVALDGFRMARERVAISTKPSESIIPANHLNELQKILGDGDVKITIGERKILFETNNTKIYSTLYSGEYFNYKDLIRKTHTTEVKINREMFRTSIERASLLAKEERSNLIKLNIADNRVKISSNTEVGNVEEVLECEINGPGLDIAFNSKYLLDGIKIMDEDEIVLNFTDSINPLIINEKSYTYLVLPVRLAN